jgi:predicted O-linked N-acetylglucosamine transferase (SPINDLY family)
MVTPRPLQERAFNIMSMRKPLGSSQMFSQALALHQQGLFREAEQLCLLVLATKRDNFDARHLLALLQVQKGNYIGAIDSFTTLLNAHPKSAEAWSNFALVLLKLKRYQEALDAFGKALAIKPSDAVTLYNQGIVLNQLGRHEDAIASYDRALAIKPQYIAALHSRANVLGQLKRYEEAVASYDRALRIGGPNQAEVLFNRGVALHLLKRHEEAMASYDQAIAVQPSYGEALYNRGNLFVELARHEDALTSYNQALAIRPDYVRALINRGNILQKLMRHVDAIESYAKALAIEQDNLEALFNRGNALLELQRHAEALASYDRARQIAPDHPHTLNGVANCALALCDWARTAELVDQLQAAVIAGQSIINPFTFLGYCDSPALQLQCARTFMRHKVPQADQLLWTGETWRHDKIRIAYLSADFRQHATAFLAVDLFERHDRSRFEVLGISYGYNDNSEMRARLVRAFDQFHDVASKTDQDVAQLLRDLEVDIIVDLKGITYSSRPAILAYRPAPIQVNYLGYPGTMGVDFMDYIVADDIVLPFEQQEYFLERIVHLPGCYQVNSQRNIATTVLNRSDAGLPETGFVFCCFNNNYKITSPVFNVWMRLLASIEGSVLWLLRDNMSAEANLRKEAGSRGIDPNRLVFADRVKLDQHLARHCLADLFLDTLPISAHTTASDALWTGLPVLTCLGRTFAGRVGASLVRAAGVPELVTASLSDYEALARRLAQEPSLLVELKDRLAHNRQAYPLFDSRQFCRHIEAAYAMMWDLWQRGEGPRSFAVS